MRSTKKTQSYASKVSRSEGLKSGGEKKVEEVAGASVEQLMQQQEGSEMESSITTVDEVVVKGPMVPQPTGGGGCPPFRFQQQPGGETAGAAGGAGGHQQPQGPPLQIYSPGSPPLPLAGPLHLVYLQPTPHGINVIPFQAVGCPTFSPSSPLGFPAHPNHPVVVQSVQSPQLPPPAFPVGPPHQYQHHGKLLSHLSQLTLSH